MKTFKNILVFALLCVPSYLRSQDASFTIDTVQISSYLIEVVPDTVDTACSYLWDFGDGETSTNIIAAHKYLATGNYDITLEVTMDSTGVSDDSTITVAIVDEFEVPNVFSPNNDAINDFFIVRSNGVTNFSIKIFSRAGTLIYKATAPVIIWDGRNLSGVEVTSGVYYYVITSDDGLHEKTGFLQLFR